MNTISIALICIGAALSIGIAGFGAGIGMGNGIVDKKLIRAGKYDEITALAKAYTDILEVR